SSRPHRYSHSFPTRRSSDLLIRERQDDIDDGQLLFTDEPPAKGRNQFAGWNRAFGQLTAVDIGSAHHRFLELAALDQVSRLEDRSEEHTSELQSRFDLVCRL